MFIDFVTKPIRELKLETVLDEVRKLATNTYNRDLDAIKKLTAIKNKADTPPTNANGAQN